MKTPVSSARKRPAPPTELKIELGMPITINNAAVAEITMRYPTVKDRLDADAYEGTMAEQELFLLARISGLAPDDFHQMHMADYMQCQTALKKFAGALQ